MPVPNVNGIAVIFNLIFLSPVVIKRYCLTDEKSIDELDFYCKNYLLFILFNLACSFEWQFLQSVIKSFMRSLYIRLYVLWCACRLVLAPQCWHLPLSISIRLARFLRHLWERRYF
jgi:hypothetical protein